MPFKYSICILAVDHLVWPNRLSWSESAGTGDAHHHCFCGQTPLGLHVLISFKSALDEFCSAAPERTGDLLTKNQDRQGMEQARSGLLTKLPCLGLLLMASS